MQIEIYTEGADSIVENPSPYIFKEFFAGPFTSVSTLIDEIDCYGDVSVHILDNDYGYVRGFDSIDEVSKGEQDRESTIQEFSSSLLHNASNADVLAVLLSKEVFLDVVVPHWNTLSDLSNPPSVWFLASSKKALKEIEIETRLKQNVIIYHRSGVARVGNEARNTLIELIEQQGGMAQSNRVYREFGGGFNAQEYINSRNPTADSNKNK